MTIIWTSRATRNRDVQMDYIGQEAPAAAIHLDLKIDMQIQLLQNHPRLGRPGRIAGTRELVVDHTPFVAVYRIRGDEIQIVRLLHSAQRYP